MTLEECYEYVDLSAGDYICGPGVAVERKESLDFINSIMDNRLFSQVRLLKAEYARPIILVEGDIFNTRSQVSPAALIGAISYITEKELCEVPGIGKKTASRIHEILHIPYDH